LNDPFFAWHESLEKRYLSNLTFQEVRRSVQALSALYVENRGRIDSGAIIDGAGKRAAFAMFYAPLHFLLVREIVKELNANRHIPGTILDIGCGTGSAGAAWALACDPRPRLIGVDRNAWALQEAKWTYGVLGLRGTVRSGDVRSLRIPEATAVIAAFTINEVADDVRNRLLDRLLLTAKRGAPVLVVEPIARRVASWWEQWSESLKLAGARVDEWRFKIELPQKLRLMDKAAGLDHREITGRSMWISSNVTTQSVGGPARQ